jgi:hypothetical protein
VRLASRQGVHRPIAEALDAEKREQVLGLGPHRSGDLLMAVEPDRAEEAAQDGVANGHADGVRLLQGVRDDPHVPARLEQVPSLAAQEQK